MMEGNSLKLDDLVFVRRGFKARQLAIVEEINTTSKGEISYIASYADGKKLRFKEKHLNKTVFVVA